MLRNATIEDSTSIARTLWNTWHHLKARQIGAPLHLYASSEALAESIRRDISRWMVCESTDSELSGFFSIAPLAGKKVFKRWRFPETAVGIEYFACLLKGEELIQQFELLAEHLRDRSILLCIPSPLRDAY